MRTLILLSLFLFGCSTSFGLLDGGEDASTTGEYDSSVQQDGSIDTLDSGEMAPDGATPSADGGTCASLPIADPYAMFRPTNLSSCQGNPFETIRGLNLRGEHSCAALIGEIRATCNGLVQTFGFTTSLTRVGLDYVATIARDFECEGVPYYMCSITISPRDGNIVLDCTYLGGMCTVSFQRVD